LGEFALGERQNLGRADLEYQSCLTHRMPGEPVGWAAPAVLLHGHGGLVRSVAWSPEGRRLASVSDDGAVRVWDPDLASQQPTIGPGHRGRVESVAWSPGGRLLASGGLDGTVRIWDPAALTQQPKVLTGHDDPVNAVAWSPDGRHLGSGGDDRTVRLWDVESAAPLCALGTGSMVCSLAWRGERIAVGTATTWTLLLVEDETAGRAEGR